MNRIDRVALVRDLQAIEAEIRPIKRVLGVTWTREMKEEQRRLVWLRARATELCAALAWSRGRVHAVPRDWPLERARAWHEEIAARFAERYSVRVEASP